MAANRLSDLIARRPLSCTPVDVDRYGRTVAVCEVGDVEIGDWLVRSGLALDWPRYSSGMYASAQAEAKAKGLGMWTGKFVEPWVYRACRREGRTSAICSGSPD